jgi:hypothetical protein
MFKECFQENVRRLLPKESSDNCETILIKVAKWKQKSILTSIQNTVITITVLIAKKKKEMKTRWCR